MLQTCKPSAPGQAWDWTRPLHWNLWAKALQQEARESDPAARATLCILARAQGRMGDAWKHYERLGADPAWVAAVTHYLLPGAPLDSKVLMGGVLAPLPNGVLLRPCLPPLPELKEGQVPALPGGVLWRKASVRHMRIGEAWVDLTISVEDSGVQIDVAHRGGQPARVSIVIPEPEGYEIRLEYLDWMQTESLRQPIVVDLKPGEEPHTLWGRMMPAPKARPTPKPGHLPAGLREEGLFLELPESDPQLPQLQAISQTLADLLKIPVSLGSSDHHKAAWTGTRMVLGPGPERASQLVWLAAATESFLLPAFDQQR